jgi:hypothetical protein
MSEVAKHNASYEFDPSIYYARKPVLELIPGKGLGRLVDQTEKFGPKFWGLAIEPELIKSTDNIATRLIYFKKILRVAPDIDAQTYRYTEMSSADLIHEGEKTKKQKIVLQRQKSGGKIKQPHVSTSYSEALSDPDITYEVYGQMLDEGDSVAKAIHTLEDWRLSEEHHAPSSHYLRLGIATFEIALLSMRQERSKELIGQAALSRHVHVSE